MDWFPWYPIDYKRDTYHLSCTEDGAYRRLIDEIMMTRAMLPNDDDALARIVGMSRPEWDTIAPRIRDFFKVRGNHLWHKRCASEMNAQDAKKHRNSERGKKGAFAKHSKFRKLAASSMLTPDTLQDKVKLTTFTAGAAKAAAEEAMDAATAQPKKKPDTTNASPALQNIMHKRGWAK